jgi:nitronate monooxygenase
LSGGAFDLRDRLGLAHAVVQAPMAGGVAGARLAAAVAGAGGLGLVGMLDPPALERELRAARRAAPAGAVGAGLLLPFARRAHVSACIRGGACAVLLFAGHDPRVTGALRAAGILVLHQVGAAADGRRAVRDGADVLVAQGTEAGGHLVATRDATTALQEVLDAAPGAPVLNAGGVATAAHARAAAAAGAAGVLAGTRFLLTPESGAHPAYKAAVLAADRTLVTQLFGFGWPLRHRVVPNRATERWCGSAGREPRATRLLGAAGRPLGRVVSQRAGLALARRQRTRLPVYTPLPPVSGLDEALVHAMPLYAGEVARDIGVLRDAGAIVRELGPALR